jgi:hypothetical protein
LFEAEEASSSHQIKTVILAGQEMLSQIQGQEIDSGLVPLTKTNQQERRKTGSSVS